MQVSFKGINNVYVAKSTKNDVRIGSYADSAGNIKRGEKSYSTIRIKCDLTDDENGNDLTKFKDALSRSRYTYEANCIDKDNPNHIELEVKRFEVDDDVEGTISNSSFKINNTEIGLTERQDLPMYTFMAYLTKNICNTPGISQAKYDCVKTFNDSVATEAMRFIDNM